MAIVPLNPIPMENRNYSNVQPFTVRDNATMLRSMEDIRRYIATVLVPHVNENVGNLDQAWAEKTLELVEQWDTQSDALVSQVQNIADQLGTSVEDAQAARDLAEAAAATAEQFASNVVAIQDDAITSLWNDPDSQFRESVNVVLENVVREDVNDPGTFFVTSTPGEAPNSGIQPDPNDPGFWV